MKMLENPKTGLIRERIFRYAPLFLWIAVIFFLSSNLGSMSNTSRFIRPLLLFLFPTAPEEILLIYHGYIRKAAHLTEYAILAFFAARAFSNSKQKILHKFWFPLSLALVVLISSLDEINQSYLSSRTGSIYDVILDTCGGLSMLLIFAFICLFWNRKYVRK